jgi:hypothetical protein
MVRWDFVATANVSPVLGMPRDGVARPVQNPPSRRDRVALVAARNYPIGGSGSPGLYNQAAGSPPCLVKEAAT